MASELETVFRVPAPSVIERDKLISTLTEIQFILSNRLTRQSLTAFTGHFADDISYISPGGVTYVGKVKAKKTLLDLWLNPDISGERDVTLNDSHSLTCWDPVNRTAWFERVWSACLTQPRHFVSGSGQSPHPVNFRYSRDELICLRFSRGWKINFFRCYYHQLQLEARLPTISTGSISALRLVDPKKVRKRIYTRKYHASLDASAVHSRWNYLVYVLGLGSINPDLSTSLFSQLFTADGVWSDMVTASVGRVEIGRRYASLLAGDVYAHSQKIETRQLHWDTVTRCLGVQFSYSAILNEPRTFGAGPLVEEYEAGAKFGWDGFAVLVFGTGSSLTELSYLRFYYGVARADVRWN